MKIKQAVLWVLTAGYGLLSGFAAFTQFGKQGANQLSAAAMAAGGVILLLSVLLDCKKKGIAKWTALAGCILIAAAAIGNGLSMGSLHLQHHLVRLLLSVVLVAGYFKLGAGRSNGEL